MTLIISRGHHALVDSNGDACRNGIVDVIRMAMDVLRIIREDYCLPPLVRPPTFSMQLPIFSNSPLVCNLLHFQTHHQCSLPPFQYNLLVLPFKIHLQCNLLHF